MPAHSTSVVIHGHFYQPPREDPWLEVLEKQAGAAPHHDWNARVEQECYRAVAAARIPGQDGKIAKILNTLELISFNFGPTLLAWMQDHAPRTYRAVLEADTVSRRRNGGHGNAIAQPYHHTILPLASRREKVTEVRWGIADFRQRFGREPVGMWLPETAVDAETLEVLAQEGIAFTILAPKQVASPPKGGLPGLYRAAGGRTVALFCYDGDLSHGVAFGALLKDAHAWAEKMAPLPKPPARGPVGSPGRALAPAPHLRSLATDGETYGHHHRFGEMALAKVLSILQGRRGVRVENFASFLGRNPPTEEVELVEPSSWSCVHGVDRWRRECGCKMDPSEPTQQAWREDLRGAMDWLAGEIHELYQEEARPLLVDPWAARDAYGDVLVGAESMEGFLRSRSPRDLTSPERVRARELLELERNALRLFTSCGWFFDDLAGLEPLQVLRYAARAVELAGKPGAEWEEGLLARLGHASTNENPPRSGDLLYLEEAKPRVPLYLAVAAGMAAAELMGVRGAQLPGFLAEIQEEGRLRVVHRRSEREWLVGTRVERPTLGRLKVRAWPWGKEEEGSSVALSDLPETFRSPLEEALREALLGRWIPSEHRHPATMAGKTLKQLVGAALAAAVRSLGGLGEDEPVLDPGGEDLEAARCGIRDLADLHDLLGLPIPFDVQTDFFRILESSSPERADGLSALRDPLGFVQT